MEAETIITEIVNGEGFYSFTPFADTYLLDKQGITSGRIILDDGRCISSIQRRHIYATLRDISLYTGYEPEQCKAIMKYDFLAQFGGNYFSLSDCNMTTARLFLQFLIDFCLEWDMPTKDALLDRDPDTARYIYSCLIHKKCCITQKKAQLHHVDAIGMGRDRNDIIHEGMRVLPLYWKLHRETHDIGRDTFDAKYHVFGIRLDKYLCEIWKVKSRC